MSFHFTKSAIYLATMLSNFGEEHNTNTARRGRSPQQDQQGNGVRQSIINDGQEENNRSRINRGNCTEVVGKIGARPSSGTTRRQSKEISDKVGSHATHEKPKAGGRAQRIRNQYVTSTNN
jgi:hypothetical protein